MTTTDPLGTSAGVPYESLARLADPTEANALKCLGGVVAGGPREPRAHARTSTGVMVSGSGSSKPGSSSK